MEDNQLIKICQTRHTTGVLAKGDKIHRKIHPNRGRQAICNVNTKENNHLT